MKKMVLFVLIFMLAGCASYFKRKECESINWFEHGQKVASRGNWLNADKTVLECRKVEAAIQESQLDQGFKSGMQKYCSNAQAYQTGKEGDFFSRELCEGPQINILIAEHAKGVNDYCAASNGQQAGASGKKYQNICPRNLEAAFLVEYRKGRKRYVNAMIDTRQNEIRDLDSKISSNRISTSNLQGQISSKRAEVSALESQKNFTAADSPQFSFLNSRLNAVGSELSSLNSQYYNLESEKRSLEGLRNSKQNEINDYKAELPSLEN